MPSIDLNSTEIWYSDTGGDGEVVLFHHGYTSSHDIWQLALDRLPSGRRYITMDARGAGDSGRPDDDSYTMANYVSDVLGVDDHLGVDTFSYVGHSMGGAIGFMLGIEHGHRLDKLILVAPIPSGGITGVNERHVVEEALWVNRAEEQLIRARLVGSARPESVDETRVESSVARLLSVSAGHYRQSWAEMDSFNVTDRLGELTTETLIVAGAADGLAQPNVIDYLRLPNASLHMFNRVGHGPPTEVPDEFADVVDDFLTNGLVTARMLLDRVNQIS